MYYELYIDVFFITNFIIDFISLCILKKIMRIEGNILRRISGAFCGSVLLCLYFILDLRYFKLNYYCLIILTGPAMLGISFKHKSIRAFVKAELFLIVIIIALNGFFNLFVVKIKHWYQIILAVTIVYFVFLLIKYILFKRTVNEKKICRIRFFIGDNQIEGKGLIDTGNCLVSPYHNRGVSVSEYNLFEDYLSDYAKSCISLYYNEGSGNVQTYSELEDNFGLEKIFAIPYKTISSKCGVLPVIVVDKLYVDIDGEEKEYTKALVGLVKDKVSSTGDINVILSTKI